MDFGNFSGFPNEDDFKRNARDTKRPKFWKKTVVIICVFIAILVLLVGICGILLEYWQLKEINPAYTGVFWTNFWAKIATWSVGVVIFFAVLATNVFTFRKLSVKKYLPANILHKKWPYVVLCAVLALYAGKIAGDDLYIRLLTALNGERFGMVDALFSRDIGYYIFDRPFYTSVIGGIKAFILLQTVALAVLYYLIFSKNGYKSLKDIIDTQRGAFVHIVVNILVYFLLIMLSYRFTAENLLYSSFGASGDIAGAGFVETVIYANYYKIAPFIVLAAIFCTALLLYRKKYLPIVYVILAVPIISVLVSVAGLITESVVVNPNERNIESKYIENNINATRDAFNLSDVNDIEYNIENNITMADVTDKSNEIGNIRITDFGASLTAYNQLQYFRKYYTFNDIDIVPYYIDGEINAIFMAAREMNKGNIDETAQSYANKMFRYTHGFGVVASPINRVTPEGQPEFVVRDIPPVSEEGIPEIKQPRIYYGELTDDYVIVGGDNKELDYSEGVSDVEYSYEGNSGIQMTPLKRLLFAAYYGDYRMIFSGNINSDSKLLINRDIMQRVKMVAPFFTYDSDPYIVIADDGTLKWVIDAYTTSSYYPYAQKYNSINYIRNSVKVIVDAYTGDMNFYIVDQDDPIAKTYKNIYPELFEEDSIPKSIIDHITVPEYMFKLQRDVYQRYHVSDPGQFYDKADVWSVATEKYNNSDIEVEPYFNVMKIDPEGEEELVLTTPFVLHGKYNMVGFLMMRTSAEHYGELVLYRMPKNMTVYGSMQVENRIDNDPEIAREMTLWNSGGSAVIRGNLLVVPFKNTILYVEPVYISTDNTSSLPELKRIIVAYKDSIAMETTLYDSLAKVLGEEGYEAPPDAESENVVYEAEDAIKNVLESYEKFRQATSANDWSKMGESLEELDRYMKELELSE